MAYSLKSADFLYQRCPHTGSRANAHKAEVRQIRLGILHNRYDRAVAFHGAYSIRAVDLITGKDGRGKQPSREPLLDASGNMVIGPEGKAKYTN
jgi:hypothetical protein